MPAPVPAAEAPRTPAFIRVNFNSDPGRAVMFRADTGKELGLTPLSIEVPYSDSAVEFVFKKPGFENKVMYIVPNLPSPLFANLQPIATKPARPEPGATTESAASCSRAQGRRRQPKKPPGASRGQKLDEDAVLEPTF